MFFVVSPLLLLNICSLCLIFVNLINMCLGVFCLGDSLGFLNLGGYFLSHFRDVFNYYILKYCLMAFLFVFFFWDSYDSNVGAFNPFTFKVIIDRCGPVAIYFVVLGSHLYNLSALPV